jgi:ubiquinone/menaquinone biosynthesis C-methylase UbiE
MSKQAAAWDKIAKQYNDDFGDDGDYSHKYILYPALQKILKDVSSKKILDLGCGTGTFTRKLADKGANAYGIDFSKEMISIASMRNRMVNYNVGDISEVLPYEDGSFEVTLSIMVFHSIEDLEIPINESFRVTKTNGRLVVVIPHPSNIHQFRSIELDDESKYLTEQKAHFKWKQFGDICEIPTEFFLRPLQYYVRTFVKAGFLINDIIEPRIIEEAKRDLNEIHTIDVWNRLYERPNFIIFDLIKNEER